VIKVSSIPDKHIYAMKIMSKSQIVKDNAVQQVKGRYRKAIYYYHIMLILRNERVQLILLK
jgi:hypothetical protein